MSIFEIVPGEACIFDSSVQGGVEEARHGRDEAKVANWPVTDGRLRPSQTDPMEPLEQDLRLSAPVAT